MYNIKGNHQSSAGKTKWKHANICFFTFFHDAKIKKRVRRFRLGSIAEPEHTIFLEEGLNNHAGLLILTCYQKIISISVLCIENLVLRLGITHIFILLICFFLVELATERGLSTQLNPEPLNNTCSRRTFWDLFVCLNHEEYKFQDKHSCIKRWRTLNWNVVKSLK